jgi:hypothetical protein
MVETTTESAGTEIAFPRSYDFGRSDPARTPTT